MNKRRLLKLADLLEADAKNKNGIRFDLGDWGTIDDETSPLSCGTTACAMGLAVVSGAFKRAGLRAFSGVDLTPVMPGDAIGVAAAANLFGISYDAADWLFTPSYYGGYTKGSVVELKVAKRIRDFVAGKASPQ